MAVVFYLASVLKYINGSERNINTFDDDDRERIDAALFQLETTFMDMILDDTKEIKVLKDEVRALRETVQEQEQILRSLRQTVTSQNNAIFKMQEKERLKQHWQQNMDRYENF